jgi:hypothetical protein
MNRDQSRTLGFVHPHADFIKLA